MLFWNLFQEVSLIHCCFCRSCGSQLSSVWENKHSSNLEEEQCTRLTGRCRTQWRDQSWWIRHRSQGGWAPRGEHLSSSQPPWDWPPYKLSNRWQDQRLGPSFTSSAGTRSLRASVASSLQVWPGGGTPDRRHTIVWGQKEIIQFIYVTFVHFTEKTVLFFNIILVFTAIGWFKLTKVHFIKR